jgi:soluble lytic murein transglycosylase
MRKDVRPKALLGRLALWGPVLCLLLPASTQSAPADLACESAEACFLAARGMAGSANGNGAADVRAQAQLERLRLLQERYPGSLWAKRAGVLSGLLLTQRSPEQAARYFRAAQRDLPVIDDYIRFWLAQARLKAGDLRQAALLLESIPEAVPDTLLAPRALLLAGEAWYRNAECRSALDLLSTGVTQAPKEPLAPTALLHLAECQSREGRPAERTASLKQLWVKYPQSPEAREAETGLKQAVEGEPWQPTPDDLFARATTFSQLALHDDAIDELQRFLAVAPAHARRGEAKLKLGTSYVRVKRYDRARSVFEDLVAERRPESDEAAVWLARVYLRLGDGDRLLAMRRFFPSLSLSRDQQDAILLITGMWLEDQGQFDQALAKYREVGQETDPAGQRLEGLWRIGWIQYRTGRYREAISTLQDVANGKEDLLYTPQALYWMARAAERLNEVRGAEWYGQLCRKFLLSYYCQLAQMRAGLSVTSPAAPGADTDAPVVGVSESRKELWHDVHYLRAMELKVLGQDQEAARELSALTQRFSRDRDVLLELSGLLTEAGAYHEALRLTRLHFLDSIERVGTPAPAVLWTAAYPTGYLPVIKAHADPALDPFLVAAIIREESHYDTRAVSRVGAIGLMQVMPATAQTVGRSLGMPPVGRDDLFDETTNLRVGIRYMEHLLQQFSGNVVQVVAAYNAGPVIVSAWTQQFGGREPDEFVELIPYQETRQYVKRVLRSYREYHRLNGACGSGSLDKGC